MARIDLRGADAVGCAAALGAAARRRRRRRGGAQGPADRRRRRRARRRGRPGVRRVVRRRAARDRSGCRPADLQSALDRAAADVRAALEVAIERTRAVHADQRRTDTTTTLAPGATVTERWVPGRTGRAVRARRQRRLPVQRGDERGARADRRRGLAGDREPAAGRSSTACRTRPSWPPRACSASTRCGRSAARRPSRCWPTAEPTPTARNWHRST